MELPEAVRKGLEDFSRNVLFDQSRTLSKDQGSSVRQGRSLDAAAAAAVWLKLAPS